MVHSNRESVGVVSGPGREDLSKSCGTDTADGHVGGESIVRETDESSRSRNIASAAVVTAQAAVVASAVAAMAAMNDSDGGLNWL